MDWITELDTKYDFKENVMLCIANIIFTVEFYSLRRIRERCNFIKPLSKHCEGFFEQGDAIHEELAIVKYNSNLRMLTQGPAQIHKNGN